MIKRSMMAVVTAIGLAASANAAEVHFFLAAGGATNGAVSCSTAAALGVNPILDTTLAGQSTLFLCMQLSSADLTPGVAILGGGLDLISGNAGLPGSHGGPGNFVVQNATRWPTRVDGTPGSVYTGTTFLSGAGVGMASANDGSNGNGPLFLIASGNINWLAGDTTDVYITIPGGGAIGSTDANGTSGGAFGWGPLPGQPDVDGRDSTNASQPGPGAASQGFFLSSLDGGPVNTSLSDLGKVPEPATLSLLGLAGLFVRRFRR